ncbi:winged helix-turn-helix transcriptional regulator [Halobacillus fulvus]|nr:winged helix-turn-helix transcriptional regulator [Halobacillus fulvus]
MRYEKMTDRERQVYKEITKNPYVSQQRLSELLDLSRSTVANLISSLVQKNILLGRAYVLNDSRQVVCIGGANVDRKFYSRDLKLKTSNPSQSSYTAGGVARNIAENLGRLGLHSSLVTAAGRDADWSIIESASSGVMNLDAVLQLPHASTGTYTAILDQEGDLFVALADMDVFEAIRPELILKNDRKLKHAECVIADLNCPKDSLELLIRKSRAYNTPLAFVTVSVPKMSRLPENLQGLTWLMTNVEETEAYFGCAIETREDWEEAVLKWQRLGIEHVTMTSGDQGVLVGHPDGITFFPSPVIENIKDVTGAGDAFSSGVLYAWLESSSLEECIKAGLKNASLCIQSNDTVRKDLTPQFLNEEMEEYI